MMSNGVGTPIIVAVGACGLGSRGCGSLSYLVFPEAKEDVNLSNKTLPWWDTFKGWGVYGCGMQRLQSGNGGSGAVGFFTPLTLKLAEDDIQKVDSPTHQFYLADVDGFKGPCCVIPDIGGHPSSYFLVKNRLAWAKEFIAWLNQPHKNDKMVFEDEEPKNESKKRKDHSGSGSK